MSRVDNSSISILVVGRGKSFVIYFTLNFVNKSCHMELRTSELSYCIFLSVFHEPVNDGVVYNDWVISAIIYI